MQLYGETLDRQTLMQYVGDIGQIGGVRLLELADGNQRGMRVAECRTGSGLEFSVLLERGMDIWDANLLGMPLAWHSQTGPVHPSFFEPEERGWLRTFHGGLLVTCGLSNAGAANVDEGEALGIHGRISHIPARQVWVDGSWQGDEYEFWVQGRMRETVVFGADLLLTRCIAVRLGESRFTVHDTVENIGHTPAPHMMLYHLNFGWPLIAPGTQIELPAGTTTAPRDDVSRPGMDRFALMDEPTPGYQEQVFFHRVPDSAVEADAGFKAVTVKLTHPKLGLSAEIRYSRATMPFLTEWKMMGAGTYTLGIEPGNCSVLGRAAARSAGELVTLQPGECKEYTVEMTFSYKPPA